MDQLNEDQQSQLHSLQLKVDEYQHDPSLCVSLAAHQCEILAELQTIYNLLINRTKGKHQPLFDVSCKRVRDRMKQYVPIYQTEKPEKLYQVYLSKYRTAKSRENNLTRLSDV